MSDPEGLPLGSGDAASPPVSSRPASSGHVVPLVDERLVMEALPLIDPIAQRLTQQLGGQVVLDDLRSIGHFALLDLVRRYDPDRSPFVPYMRQRLRWAMLDGLRRQTHGRALVARARALAASDRFAAASRRAAKAPGGMPPSEASFRARLRQILRDHAAVVGIKLVTAPGGEAAVTPSSANPERATLQRRALAAVREVVASLEDERERTIVQRHYFGGETFHDIAVSMGLSKAWVSRLHARAITLIAKRLRARGYSR